MCIRDRVKTYMWMSEGEGRYYFRWSCNTDGTPNSDGPAPDEMCIRDRDIVGRKEWLDIGFLYDVGIAAEKGMEEEAYLKAFLEAIAEDLPVKVRSYVGDAVSSIEDISCLLYTSRCV